jgi:hypothetical protein
MVRIRSQSPIEFHGKFPALVQIFLVLGRLITGHQPGKQRAAFPRHRTVPTALRQLPVGNLLYPVYRVIADFRGGTDADFRSRGKTIYQDNYTGNI